MRIGALAQKANEVPRWQGAVSPQLDRRPYSQLQKVVTGQDCDSDVTWHLAGSVPSSILETKRPEVSGVVRGGPHLHLAQESVAEDVVVPNLEIWGKDGGNQGEEMR